MTFRGFLLAAAIAATTAMTPANAQAATRHTRSHEKGPAYPMKAEEFRALMDKRIDRVRAAIDKKLDHRGVSADRKKQIHKIFDEASKELRAEIAHATADGTVTQSEADKVKALAVGLRAKVRERMRAERNPAAKERLDREDAKAAAKSKDHERAKGHDKAQEHDKAKDHDKHEAKVAKAEPPNSGTTKATKAKVDAKKKGSGPTKHAKSPPKKPPPEKHPTSGEADL